MANTIITPSIIAREVLDNLYETTLMANLVHRDFEQDFMGKQGDTITVRTPATFTTYEFARPGGITVQNATEGSFTVVLDKLPDVSFAITSEELTLKVDDFSNRFLVPAAESIAQYVDTKLLALIANTGVLTENVTGTGSADITDPAAVFPAMDRKLNDANVPKSDRHAVFQNKIAEQFKKSALFTQYLQRGDTRGLVEASIDRKWGFDSYTSTNLPDPAPYSLSVGFHRSALALVTRTLAAPNGVAPNMVSVVNYKGLGLRVVQSYDNALKQDVISIDMLCGFKLLDQSRAVLVQDKA